MNTKQKGNIAIGRAIHYFAEKGYTTSLPLNDSQDYDLIVDDGISLKKVQVKYTSHKSKYGKFVVGLRSISGSTRKAYKTLIDTSVDLLFVFTSENDCYLFNVSEIENSTALTLPLR